MPKIRGFKPDLWTDDTFVEVSPFARLLWLGMWNFACDNGHLQDKSKQIKMRVLPTDDVNCADLLRELESQGLVVRADGWITVPNLEHHQKPDRRYFTTCPKEGCTRPDGNPERKTHRAHGGTRRGHGVSTPRPLGDGDGDGDGEVITTSSADANDADFEAWWKHYPRKIGKGQARKAYKTARKKTDQATLVAAIQQQAPRLTARGAEFCPHGSTWLNGERWDDQPDTALFEERPPWA